MSSELAAALAAVQSELPRVGKTSEADTGTYKYRYADLHDVSAAIMPLLGKHGLSFTARPTLIDGRFVLAYSLLHASGDREDGAYPLPDKATPQQYGSAITYARRYCLCAVTGIAPDEDDGGAEACRVKPAQSRPRTAQRPPGATAGQRQPVRADPEHERLQPRREPGDRPAERSRGPIPPDEDRWAGQPAGQTPWPASDTGPGGAIVQHFKRLEVLDRDERLALTAQLAGWAEGREITSTNDLTAKERARVLAQLGKLRDHAALMALVVSGDAPAGVTS